MSKSRKMSEAQKRRRRYARNWGKTAASYIRRAVEHQQQATYWASRPGCESTAEVFQSLSDNAVTYAAEWAAFAAGWAHKSEETL